MAIAYAGMRCIQRSKGHTVTLAAAYRSASKIQDERTGLMGDYSDKDGVVFSEIILPENADEKFKERSYLWNSVEQFEKRKDALVGRECILALPKDAQISNQDRITLARMFAKKQFVDKGYAVDINIHHDNKENPHAHILITPRTLEGANFAAKKTYDLAPQWGVKGWQGVQNWGEAWRDFQNEYFQKQQKSLQVDANGLIAQIHLGSAVFNHPEREKLSRWQEYQARKRLNEEVALTLPERAILSISSVKSHFTEVDMACYLHKHTLSEVAFTRAYWQLKNSSWLKKVDQDSQGHEIYTLHTGILATNFVDDTVLGRLSNTEAKHELKQMMEQHSVFTEAMVMRALSKNCKDIPIVKNTLAWLKDSNRILPLGPGNDGQIYYTTKMALKTENKLQNIAEHLFKRSQHKVGRRTAKKICAKFSLSLEQQQAVEHILHSPDIALIVGRAGTGKSYSLQAARAVWEKMGYQVYGMALSGKAAKGLQQGAGIASDTIDSFLLRVENKHLKLSSNSILVMDEIGMTDSSKLLAVLTVAKKYNAKLVGLGDPEQLQPIGYGAPFRALIERVGVQTLSTIYRQQTDWQIEASQDLAVGKVDNAIKAYAEKDEVHLLPNQQQAIDALVTQWLQNRQQSPEKSQLILAHRNQEVININDKIHRILKEQGQLHNEREYQTDKGALVLAEGDTILLRKNDRQWNVKNGQTAKVIKTAVNSLTIQLQDDPTQFVNINVTQYPHISLGYAVTVHKAQGMTVDQAYVYASGNGWDRHLSYVAGTRHRHALTWYANKEEYRDLGTLSKCLSRLGQKDSTLNYQSAFARRRGFLYRIVRPFKSLINRPLDQKEKSIFKTRVRAKKVALYADYIHAARSTYLDIIRDVGSKDIAAIQTHPEYKAWCEMKMERDMIAYQISNKLESYIGAFRYYSSINANDLNKYAQKHAIYKNTSLLQEYKSRVESVNKAQIQYAQRDKAAHKENQQMRLNIEKDVTRLEYLANNLLPVQQSLSFTSQEKSELLKHVKSYKDKANFVQKYHQKMRQKGTPKLSVQKDLQQQAQYFLKNKENYQHVLAANKLSEEQLQSDYMLISNAIQRQKNQQQTYGKSEQRGGRGL
jgi:ATP-dependent exoDNAse (exonuclease V) alpha subunit